MLAAVQHPGALAPAEPSPKADDVLLLLAMFSLVNIDLGMYSVCLNLV